ncbi:MAG: GntR family transcriptional regulator [Solirubrobacteraceae bacterium]
MASTEPSLDAGIFGGRWSVVERSTKPAWVQIEEQLADRIESGRLGAGERLPPERDLAEALSVSRMTVRQALASLAARGLVERGVGRGTFVREAAKVVHDLTRVAGFTEEVEGQGLEAGARILDAAQCAAPDRVAQALGLEAGAPVIRLERVRLAGPRPMTLEDTWVPGERFPGLLDHDLSGSLYALMRDRYDLGPVSATERLEPVAARSHEAAALEVAEGCPLMFVERIAYARDGTPVEYAHDRHRGDHARFVIRVVPDELLARAR